MSAWNATRNADPPLGDVVVDDSVDFGARLELHDAKTSAPATRAKRTRRVDGFIRCRMNQSIVYDCFDKIS